MKAQRTSPYSSPRSLPASAAPASNAGAAIAIAAPEPGAAFPRAAEASSFATPPAASRAARSSGSTATAARVCRSLPALCGPESPLSDDELTALARNCSADPVVCSLYARHLHRLPEKAGAIYWGEEAQKLRDQGLDDELIEERLAGPFRGGIPPEDATPEELSRWDDAWAEAHEVVDPASVCEGETKCRP
ncbi:MAG: hypothetical protein HY925_03370 [Elusimicrobia bacterium]|nr:hypothetical protein [Elusimicrobiota bacterium]